MIVNYNKEVFLRKEKLKNLKIKNRFAFPNSFTRNCNSKKLNILYNNTSNENLKNLKVNVSIAGRIITKRIMGKVSFITLQDQFGNIQIYVKKDILSNINISYEEFKKLDIGDIIGIKGTLFKTKTGELSIRSHEIILLTKSLRPLPDKFKGLRNKEICYRKRYLDLISNIKSRRNFFIRSKILREIRNFMHSIDFIEVETPMMHSIPGGASAKPFSTYHNSFNSKFYLRISPELYLKRLIVGGFEKIFEINRNFRNEGLSPCHSPEFTMMELYMAYSNYKDLMKLTEDLFFYLSNKIKKNHKIIYGKNKLNFKNKFSIMTMQQAICNYESNININDLNNILTIKEITKILNLRIDDNWNLGRIQLEIFEKRIKKHLIKPTFITSYPKDVSPLARCDDHNPFLTERFEIFICGMEIGNGFSELNDAEEQLNRFKEQLSLKNSHDSSIYDKDYIVALEHGLPPTAGLGIGIDRLVMLFTNNNNINDIILFPNIKPVNSN